MSTRDEKNKPELGRVDDVEKKLYAKNTRIKDYNRTGFNPGKQESHIPRSWKDKQTQEQDPNLLENKKTPRTPMTLFPKILIASVLFFMFSALTAYLVYELNANQVTYDAVELAVLGPNTIAAGEELSFNITVTNNNQVPVVLSDIVVNYPSGTVTADEEALAMTRDINAIDSIQPGLSETISFSGVLYGAENDTKDITITYQYRVPESDNIFFKERVYQVQLVKSPVVVSVDHDSMYQSGDEVRMAIKVQSNANKALRNLLLSIDYPFGFEFASSSETGIDQSTYRIGVLDPGEIRELEIVGTIRGQDDEERTVRYILGAQHAERPGELGTIYTTTNSVLRLAKPPVMLALGLNDSTNETYIAQPGQQIRGIMEYTNTLTTKLLDTELSIILSGAGYDRRSVSVPEGLYRSNTDTLSWTRTEDQALAEIETAESGEYDFRFEVMDTDAMAGVIQNPEIILDVSAEATNFELGGDEKQVGGSLARRIKVETEPYLNAYLLHSIGPFDNTGPIRPEVGTSTTYTLVLEVGNSTNEITDGVVTFMLPRYVEPRELMLPQEADIEFDTRSRILSWRVGTIAPGVGYTTNERTLYLSLDFEPSLDHLDRSPALVQNIRVSGIDSFTETQVQDSTGNLSTDLGSDPDFGFTNPNVRSD